MAITKRLPGVDASEARDSMRETILQQHGLAWELEYVAIKDIDITKSRHNQARKEALENELVENYTRRLKEGWLFPPICLRRLPNGTLYVLDGNHTLTAHQSAGEVVIAAYIIECTDATASLLAAMFNTVHGANTNEEWRKEQIKHLLSIGMSQVDIAKELGVSTTAVGNVHLTNEARLRLATLKEPAPTKIGTMSLIELNKIKNDPAFVETARLIKDANLNSEQIKALVKQVTSATSEGEQLARIAAEREASIKIKTQGPARPKIDPEIAAVDKALGILRRVDATKLKTALKKAPADLRTRVFDNWMAEIGRIDGCF